MGKETRAATVLHKGAAAAAVLVALALFRALVLGVQAERVDHLI
jgi:hypothetical protein